MCYLYRPQILTSIQGHTVVLIMKIMNSIVLETNQAIPSMFAVKIVQLKVDIIFSSPMTLAFTQGQNCVSNLTMFTLPYIIDFHGQKLWLLDRGGCEGREREREGERKRERERGGGGGVGRERSAKRDGGGERESAALYRFSRSESAAFGEGGGSGERERRGEG